MMQCVSCDIFYFLRRGIALGLCGCVFLSGCNKPLPEEAPPKAIEATVVKQQPIEQHTRLMGTVRAARETHFCAKTSGILRIKCIEGRFAVANTLLAYVQNDALVKRVELLEEIEIYKQADYKRYNNLYTSQHISASEFEKTKQECLRIQYEMHDARNALKETQIRAPYDGVCGLFHFPDGAFVKAGDQVVTFYDHSVAYVDISVPTPLLLKDMGKTVRVDDKVDGELVHVVPVVESTTQMGLARAKIPSKCFPLGSTVFVDVITDRREQALVVARECIFWRDGKAFVYKIEDSKLASVQVQLGLQDKQNQEILAGLQAGDRIVRRVQDSLYDGCIIEVVQLP